LSKQFTLGGGFYLHSLRKEKRRKNDLNQHERKHEIETREPHTHTHREREREERERERHQAEQLKEKSHGPVGQKTKKKHTPKTLGPEPLKRNEKAARSIK